MANKYRLDGMDHLDPMRHLDKILSDQRWEAKKTASFSTLDLGRVPCSKCGKPLDETNHCTGCFHYDDRDYVGMWQDKLGWYASQPKRKK